MFYKHLKLLRRPQRSVDFEPLDPGKARTCEKKRRYPSDISSFSHLIESTRRRRTSGGRSPATTGVERRHSNRSNPAGLEHRKKSHPSDDSFSISLRARDVAERPGDVRLRRPERSVDIRTVRTRQGSNIQKRRYPKVPPDKKTSWGKRETV